MGSDLIRKAVRFWSAKIQLQHCIILFCIIDNFSWNKQTGNHDPGILLMIYCEIFRSQTIQIRLDR